MMKTIEQNVKTTAEIKDVLGRDAHARRNQKASGGKLKDAKINLGEGEIALLKEEVKGLLKAETSSQFGIGDRLFKLRSQGQCNWRSLGKEFGRNHTTLCTYAKVAEAFPPTVRDYTKEYSWYAAIYASEKITVKQLSEKKGLLVEPNYAEALRVCLDNPEATKSSRDVTTFLVSKANAQLPEARPSEIPSACHHASIEEFLRTVTPLKARIIHLDPPFGAFFKIRSGVCDRSTSKAQLTACDNADRDEAIGTTVAFFEELGKRLDDHLALGGVVLLWQNEELRWQIAKAIEDAGLRVGRMIPWAKNGNGKPGTFSYPWTNCLETLYVIHRPDDKIIHGEYGKPCSNGELLFRPVRQSRYSIEKHHHFEKPVELMEFLIKLHSMPGELVVDAYGCTGSFSVAAQRIGRKWVYVESNQENYSYGSKRVAIEVEQTMSGEPEGSTCSEPSDSPDGANAANDQLQPLSVTTGEVDDISLEEVSTCGDDRPF